MQPYEKLLNKHLRAFSQLTDSEVIVRVLDGDLALFELIMRRYNGLLYRVARGILKYNGLAEDAVQETYLTAFRRLDQFRGPEGFGAWLTKICIRNALHILRRDSRLRAVGDDDGSDCLSKLSAAPSSEPEANTLARETAAVLEHAVESLPRDYRLVYILREIEGLNIQETAESLCINQGTVKSRLHRARQAVRSRCRYQLDDIKSQVYPFAGQRCDRIVRLVFSKLDQTISRGKK